MMSPMPKKLTKLPTSPLDKLAITKFPEVNSADLASQLDAVSHLQHIFDFLITKALVIAIIVPHAAIRHDILHPAYGGSHNSSQYITNDLHVKLALADPILRTNDISYLR